jgi:hypothetical protein
VDDKDFPIPLTGIMQKKIRSQQSGPISLILLTDLVILISMKEVCATILDQVFVVRQGFHYIKVGLCFLVFPC